jgi:hypothetical protein
MEAPPENFAYTLLLSPDFSKPDALAVIDAKAGSPTFSQIVHTVTMPYKGDEFHHFGWNACSSALSPLTGHAFLERRYLIIPGLRSSRIYIVDTKPDPTQAKIHKIIEPKEVFKKTGYSRPHTVPRRTAEGKGILAADETIPTLTKRFNTLGIKSTEQSRRTYREMLFTSPGAAEFISGVIMYDETIRQKSSSGAPLVETITAQGILPGIKVDTGAKPLAGFTLIGSLRCLRYFDPRAALRSRETTSRAFILKFSSSCADTGMLASRASVNRSSQGRR